MQQLINDFHLLTKIVVRLAEGRAIASATTDRSVDGAILFESVAEASEALSRLLVDAVDDGL